jgi:predicted HD superfamily hydrolase involved in NAD metabolism
MGIDRSEGLLLKELERLCKPSRQAHCRSVAETAVSLARRFSLDPAAARLAGLGHDLVKDQDIGFQWELARRAGSSPDMGTVAALVAGMEAEQSFADKIIHGPAAAVYMRQFLGIGDPLILKAVSLHSSAAAQMDNLSAIIFIADKMEPGRKYSGSREAEALRQDSIKTLLLKALDLSMQWLNEKGYAIAQSSIDLYNALTMDKNRE